MTYQEEIDALTDACRIREAEIARLRAERDDLHATNEQLVALMCTIADYYEHHFVEGQTAYQAVILIRAALAADGKGE